MKLANNDSIVQEKIIDKIKKLLALSEGNGTAEESQSAILKAQELMIKYNIEMHEVEEKDKIEGKEVVDVEITEPTRTRWWVGSLANVISENFRCKCYISTQKMPRYTGKASTNSLHYIGLVEDVELAIETFRYAKIEIEQFSKEYANNYCNMHCIKDTSFKNGLKNDFISGYIRGLGAKFKEQVEKNNWGLILVKDDAVIAYEEKIGLKPKKAAPINSSNSKSAFREGYETGNRFGNKLGG